MVPVIARRRSAAGQRKRSPGGYRSPNRVGIEGPSSCVAAAASFGRRFGHHSANRRDVHRRASMGFQPQAFEGHLAHADCGRARRNWPRNQGWRTLMRRSEGLGCVSCDGSDGKGLSRSAPTSAAHNTCFTLRGASRRWPPQASWHRLWERRWKRLRRPSVGSRRFVKQSTLAATARGSGARQSSRFLHVRIARPIISWLHWL
jgi:hypothetical protein